MSAIEVMVRQRRNPHLGGEMETQDSSAGGSVVQTSVHASRSGQAPVESLDQILGSMVHAISNSLNSVMAASQLANLLITQGRLEEAKASLDRVEEECSRTARLLRDGRNLATLRVPEPLDGVDVPSLLASCAAACTDLGEVRVDCDADLPLVHGQADALKRLFVEILDNAFQFGAHNIQVSAKADRGQGTIRVEFRDDGPGVQLQPATLFESFVTSEPAEHSGLGLAIATQIAAAYDGAIGLDESQDGAVFWARLPLVSP
ncbi:MAG TPA: HAMP domain-containing sensor histidine kinase [Rhodanobacteraceae bacterium]|nr:HAMP domain-containing sensor histidine kinase [Rhodanobacteraceae bacterium]